MLKILALVIVFARELVFDSLDEQNYKSPNFNFKKSALFVILVLLFTLNGFLVHKAFLVAQTNIELRQKIEELEKIPCKK